MISLTLHTLKIGGGRSCSSSIRYRIMRCVEVAEFSHATLAKLSRWSQRNGICKLSCNCCFLTNHGILVTVTIYNDFIVQSRKLSYM